LKETIHIACAADNTYVQHTGVMLTSLFENNTSNNIHIHLFSAAFSEENKNHIENIVKKYRQSFSFYTLEQSLFDGCYISHHVSYATYYRIVIPKIIDKNISKILYLDTDIIVRKDLLPFWQTNIENAIIGAVLEPLFDDFKRLNIPPENKYFNAGILMINIESWVSNNLTDIIFTYISNYKNLLTFWDQDALNANLYKNWFSLPPKWNQQSAVFELSRKKLLEVYREKELDEALNDPSIVHYTGSSKPWDYLNLHPMKGEYFKYLNKTIWKDYQFPNVTFSKRIQKFLMRIFGVKTFQKIVSVTLSS